MRIKDWKKVCWKINWSHSQSILNTGNSYQKLLLLLPLLLLLLVVVTVNLRAIILCMCNWILSEYEWCEQHTRAMNWWPRPRTQLNCVYFDFQLFIVTCFPHHMVLRGGNVVGWLGARAIFRVHGMGVNFIKWDTHWNIV